MSAETESELDVEPVETEETDEVEEIEIDASGPDAVELDFGPTVLSSRIAVAAAVFAAITSGPYSGFALPFSLAGLGFVAAGLYRAESRAWLGLGVVSLFLGIVFADMFGPLNMGVGVFLISATATIVTWDVGQHAITIGDQFGRQAPTQRGELVHAGGSVFVGILASGFAYTIYFFGLRNQPTLAVAALMFGAVLLVWALRD